MNFILPMGTYPFDIMISIKETDKEVKKNLKKHGISTKKLDLNRGGSATCYFSKGRVLIRFRDFKDNVMYDGMVTHELFHAVEFVFKYIGIPHSDDTSEAWAYQLGYLVREFYTKYLDEKGL